MSVCGVVDDDVKCVICVYVVDCSCIDIINVASYVFDVYLSVVDVFVAVCSICCVWWRRCRSCRC